MEKIDQFFGKHYFLSNFYERPFSDESGTIWKTTEHYYQAQKTFDDEWIEKIKNAKTPGKAKRLGSRCPLREDWEESKFFCMSYCVREKFFQHEDLAKRLLDTGNIYLEEGNNWGDRVWGRVNGEGLNLLGRILMKVRRDLNDNLCGSCNNILLDINPKKQKSIKKIKRKMKTTSFLKKIKFWKK